jgi:hypothetical protein
MTDPERDEEFEAYLRRRSALSTRVQSEEKLEPPHDLDDIVLRKARQAIQAPQQLPLYKAPRWALPVALVATILLCFAIVLNVSVNMRRQSAVSSSRLAQAPAPTPRSLEANAKPAAPRAKAEVILPEAKVAVPHSSATEAYAPAGAASPPSRDPTAWLKRIDALRAAGETARADAELTRFRAAFPAYPYRPSRPPASEPPK